MRLAHENMGDVVLLDVAKGLAQGKAYDLEDARALLKLNYNIKGTDDINQIKDSSVVVITAGLARKPGMTREDLLNKNAVILRDVCFNIKKLAPEAIVIIVTNPLDLLTYFALQFTGFNRNKVFGMGVTLDAARFVNLISKELNVPAVTVEACVIGSHGEGMLPLARYSKVNGVTLETLLDSKKVETLISGTIDRGREIVSLLGSGSAYFAPSAAITELVKAIVKDEKRVLGVSAYLNGEYGISDVCVGVPCRLGRNGIEQIIELDLNAQEKESFQNCANKLKDQFASIAV